MTGKKKPRREKGTGRKLVMVQKLTSDDWTDECRKVVEYLKDSLIKEVLLAHPDFSRPFILSVDALTRGLGAVLSQVQKGHAVGTSIVFVSKALNYAQSK